MKLFKLIIGQGMSKRFKRLLNLRNKKFKLKSYLLKSRILKAFRDRIWCSRILNSHNFKTVVYSNNSFKMLRYSSNSFKILLYSSNSFNIQITSFRIHKYKILFRILKIK